METQSIRITGAFSGIEEELAWYFLEKVDNDVINSTTADKQ